MAGAVAHAPGGRGIPQNVSNEDEHPPLDPHPATAVTGTSSTKATAPTMKAIVLGVSVTPPCSLLSREATSTTTQQRQIRLIWTFEVRG